MNTYFCPRCGRGLEARDCRRGGAWAECPACAGGHLQVSGGALLACALVWLLLMLLLLCHDHMESFAVNAAVAGPLSALGVLRIVRRLRARVGRRAPPGGGGDGFLA